MTPISTRYNPLKITQPVVKVAARFSTTRRTLVKQYDDIPISNSLLPSWLSLVLSGGPGQLHEHIDKRHKELGPIFRESLGSKEMVFIADTTMIQTTIANEGTRPHHNVPEAWIQYNSLKNIQRGLFFNVGESWIKLRRVFNKVMLSEPRNITRFSSDLLSINSDLLNSWQRNNRNLNCDELVIKDVKRELNKWSIESTGLMLFGHRMGCVAGDNRYIDKTADDLVTSVARMFETTSKFQILPVKLAQRFNTKTWRLFEESCDRMLNIANKYAQDYTQIAKLDNTNPSLVRDILDLNALTDDEIMRSIVDLIIASADTTSNSLQWVLYMLGKREDVQSRLFNESQELLDRLTKSKDSLRTLSDIPPYIRAFVKEVSRLYPTAPFLARTLDHEITLDCYRVPANTPIVLSLFTTSRLENYFEEPNKFRPERWLKLNKAKCPSRRSHAYASLPFGVGLRKCIGHRAAELEICLFVASLLDKFKCYSMGDAEIKLQMILGPNKPIELRLVPR